MAENTTNKNTDEEKNNNTQKRPMTAEEIAKAKRRREVAIKRARQALSNATAEEKEEIFQKVHLDRKVEKPTTFKGKWDNFWYHYKLTVLLVVAVVGLSVWVIHDVVTKKEYDLTVMIISSEGYTTPQTEIDEFENSMKELTIDANSDGKVEFLLSDIRIGEDMDTMVIQAGMAKYTASISSVEDIIYIVNDDVYNMLKEQGVIFEDLTKYSTNSSVQGDKYLLKDDERFKNIVGYEDMYLVVRDVNAISDVDKKVLKKYDNAIEFVKKIIK